MLVFIKIVGVIALLVFFYLVFVRFYLEKSAKKLKYLLKHEYLWKKYDEVKDIIANTRFENIVIERDEEGRKYIVSMYYSRRTLKIFEFENNVCVNFYIMSGELSYALPGWVDIMSDAIQRVRPYNWDDDFFDIFSGRKVEFMTTSKCYFISTWRCVAIDKELPRFSRVKSEIYYYLVSTNFDSMNDFRKRIYLKFFDEFSLFDFKSKFK